jgi:FMN reductase
MSPPVEHSLRAVESAERMVSSPNGIAVVVGNPKPDSRTLHTAIAVAAELTEQAPGTVIDLATVGPALLDWTDLMVADLVAQVVAARFVVVASPVYKGSYTGLLKLFLDRFAAGALDDVPVVPLMLGGSPAHSLAVEVFLRPLLAELGALCPSRGLYLLEAHCADLEYAQAGLDRVRRDFAAALAGLR